MPRHDRPDRSHGPRCCAVGPPEHSGSRNVPIQRVSALRAAVRARVGCGGLGDRGPYVVEVAALQAAGLADGQQPFDEAVAVVGAGAACALAQGTANRSARSARLFVGSTPGISVKFHIAGQRSRSAEQKRLVFSSRIREPCSSARIRPTWPSPTSATSSLNPSRPSLLCPRAPRVLVDHRDRPRRPASYRARRFRLLPVLASESTAAEFAPRWKAQ